MTKIFASVAASALLAIAFTPAHANTLYNNINASQDGADPVYGYGPIANSFSTGSTAVRLDGVQLLLDNLSADYTGNLQVGLFSDVGTAPGALLASLGTLSFANVSTSGTANYAFAPIAATALSANTRYWIEITGTAANAVQWSWSSDLASVGVAGQYNWSQELGINPNGPSWGPYQMAVEVSAVPEPATAVLACVGLGLLWGARRPRS